MGYSLRDAKFLFWLIKDKGMPLPLVHYLCDYKFFDFHNYFLAINDPQILIQQKKRLHEHLGIAKRLREMLNYSKVGEGNIALYTSFRKSSHQDKFDCVEVENFGVKDKPVIYHCWTFFLEFILETSQQQWVVIEEAHLYEKGWRKMWENRNIPKIQT